MAEPITPERLRKPGDGGGGYDERGCKEGCEQRFPNHYKWIEQKEPYDECVRACEVQGRRVRGEDEDGDEGGAACPEGKGREYEGCPCGEVYGTFTGNCASGYVFQTIEGPKDLQKDGAEYKEGMTGRCVCRKAISDWRSEHGGGGEFKWSPEVQALIQRLLGRAGEFFDSPLGLSEEERDALYNRAFEKIKAAEAPRIQSATDRIARMGLLHSPFAQREIEGEKRFTGEMLSATERDIEIDEAKRRFNELMTTTSMIQQILGTGMSSEQLIEAINASRRGESRDAMNQLLQYFSMLTGGQGNEYWQAILSQYGQGGGGGDFNIWDWLPYFGYEAGDWFERR